LWDLALKSPKGKKGSLSEIVEKGIDLVDAESKKPNLEAKKFLRF
jgi:hypothetical protein